MIRKNKLAELLMLTLLGVLLSTAKFVLATLPNIELVSLLIAVYTYKFRLKALIPTYIFVGIDIMLYGINIWNVMYLYVWAIVVFVCLPLKKVRWGWVFALVLGIFGLLFGTLCSIPYFFAFGPQFALSWIASGMVFDCIHGAGNFLITFLLYVPLTKALDRIIA